MNLSLLKGFFGIGAHLFLMLCVSFLFFSCGIRKVPKPDFLQEGPHSQYRAKTEKDKSLTNINPEESPEGMR